VSEKEYQAALEAFREDWGSVFVDRSSPGLLRAVNDQTTGIFAGMRAALFAEILNRALKP
jgi:hypothetical protein